MNGDSSKPQFRRVLAVVRWPVGGIRTYILYNYPHLMQAGYRFTFVGPGDDTFYALRKELASWDGAEFVEAPIVGRKCRLCHTVRKLLRENCYSLIHSHGLTAAIHVEMARISFRVPHAITSHDVIRANQFPGVKGWVKRWIMARILRRANVLIAVSHDALANHLEYLPGIGRGKCRLVPLVNGIDTSKYANLNSEKPNILRNKLDLPEGTFLAGFLGRFMEQKGFLILVEAMDRLFSDSPDLPFHLLAVGSGDYIREYRAVVNRSPLVAPRITFMDAVPDVTPILQELDLLVMPSLWEACGLLAMEAMCVGIPVLGSDCKGLREILLDSPSELSATGDADSLASLIQRAMLHPWGKKADEYKSEARERFSVLQRVKEFIGLINGISLHDNS